MKKLIAITLSVVLILSSFIGVYAEESSAAQDSANAIAPESAAPVQPASLEGQAAPETPATEEVLTPEEPKTEEQISIEEADSFGTAAEELINAETEESSTEAAFESKVRKEAAVYKQFEDEFRALTAARIETTRLVAGIKSNNIRIKTLTRYAKEKNYTRKLVTARAIELEIEAAEHLVKIIRAEKNKLWEEFDRYFQAKQYRKAELILKKIVAAKKTINMVLKDITSLQAREIEALK